MNKKAKKEAQTHTAHTFPLLLSFCLNEAIIVDNQL
jgi:hypothetical protein